MPIKSLIVFILSFFLVLSLITYNSSLVTAQTQSALEKAQSDYTFQFTKYRDAQEKYISAKAEYKSFQTATAKNDAFIKTRDYLIQVDKLYLNYFASVTENGNAINFSAHGDDKNNVNRIISGETAYLNDHMQKVNTTKTLEELPPLAVDLKKHISDTSTQKLNKILATYETVESEAALDDFTSLSRVLDRVVVFKLRAGETKSILANWSSEIKDIRTKTETPLTNAREALNKIKEDQATDGDLANISQMALEAKGQLKRSKPLFEEVVRIL